MNMYILFLLFQVFQEWNKTELDSFLIEITANILKYKDTDGKYLLPKIRDSAGQKGTGKWTAISALEYGIPVTLIGNWRFDPSTSMYHIPVRSRGQEAQKWAHSRAGLAEEALVGVAVPAFLPWQLFLGLFAGLVFTLFLKCWQSCCHTCVCGVPAVLTGLRDSAQCCNAEELQHI